MTKGYITSLSRSPGDQYTWLSSLTEFPQTPRPKGGPAQNLRRLMLERATSLLIWLTTLPLSLNPSLLSSEHTHVCQLSTGPVCSWGPLFIFIGVWGFTLVKRQGQSQSGIFVSECFLFSLRGWPLSLQGWVRASRGLAGGEREGRPGAPRG